MLSWHYQVLVKPQALKSKTLRLNLSPVSTWVILAMYLTSLIFSFHAPCITSILTNTNRMFRLTEIPQQRHHLGLFI